MAEANPERWERIGYLPTRGKTGGGFMLGRSPNGAFTFNSTIDGAQVQKTLERSELADLRALLDKGLEGE